MKSMRKLLLLSIVVSLLLVSCTITSASATKGWVKSESLPKVRHTATNPGSIKICGDHKCAPFEDMTKLLQNKLKQNQSVQVKQPTTKTTIEKKIK